MNNILHINLIILIILIIILPIETSGQEYLGSSGIYTFPKKKEKNSPYYEINIEQTPDFRLIGKFIVYNAGSKSKETFTINGERIGSRVKINFSKGEHYANDVNKNIPNRIIGSIGSFKKKQSDFLPVFVSKKTIHIKL